jgi:hypothetical protein
MQTKSFLAVLFLLLTLLLSACGGGDGEPGTAGAYGLMTLMAASTEAPGAQCPSGGSRIDAGLDADRDGTLVASEIGSTQYVCHGAGGANGADGGAGAPGSDGLNALVQMLDEPSGAHCGAGGKAINAGIDSNANGILDAAEVSSSGYVCNAANGANGADGSNGIDGTNGTNGTNGLTTLMSIVSEPAGANCTYGGNKVSKGLDSNANSVLDAGEVSATSYLCNGAPSAALTWVDVTGTAQQAQPNTQYIARNDTAQVVVTLPNNADLAVGDIVRITGAGLGGWKVAQNSGQTVYTTSLGSMAGASWTAHAPNLSWNSLASSADGRKLVAAPSNNQIYTSTDSGMNWTARMTDANRNWFAVASSTDGSKLVAVVRGGAGQIYTSIDSGVSWTPRMTDAGRDWQALASSADGSKLVAGVRNGQLYTSTDSGASWTPRDSARAWRGAASSSDGIKLVAVDQGGQIYTSIDSGVSWTPRESARNWQSVASSADGSRLVAAVNSGLIYTSIDSGVTWTARMTDVDRSWLGVASSDDGRRLLAAAIGGLYASTDGGVSWTPRVSSGIWTAATSSADGSRLAAAAGQIHTSIASTTPGTAGAISGTSSDAIELQYMGGGTFSVLSHEGDLSVD